MGLDDTEEVKEIELAHDVDGNVQPGRHEDHHGLAVGVVKGEEANPALGWRGGVAHTNAHLLTVGYAVAVGDGNTFAEASGAIEL